jgi:hypothetical protein
MGNWKEILNYVKETILGFRFFYNITLRLPQKPLSTRYLWCSLTKNLLKYMLSIITLESYFVIHIKRYSIGGVFSDSRIARLVESYTSEF